MHFTAKHPYAVSNSIGTKGGQQAIFSSTASVYSAALLKSCSLFI